jgi:phage repressor protein C with HTH and peptisase S24 domain
MSDSEFTARFKEIVKEFGGQNAFSRKANISVSGVARLFSGGTPTLSTINSIANATGVSILWLVSGEGSMYEPDQNDRSQTSARTYSIPILDVHASAGHGTIVEDEAPVAVMNFSEDTLRALNVAWSSSLHFIYARGTSMEPTIKDKDMLLVDTVITALQDNAIYVFNRADSIIVKRLRMPILGDLEIISDNGNIIEKIPFDMLAEVRPVARVIRIMTAA